MLEIPEMVYPSSNCAALTGEGVGLEKSLNWLIRLTPVLRVWDLPGVVCVANSPGLRRLVRLNGARFRTLWQDLFN